MNTQMFPDLVINGETIPQTAVAAELQNHTASKDNFADALRNAANALVIRTLLLQQARKNGIEATPQEVSPNRFETEDEAKIRALWKAKSTSRARLRKIFAPNGRRIPNGFAPCLCGKFPTFFANATRMMP